MTCPKRNFLGNGNRCLRRFGHEGACKFPTALAGPVDVAARREVAQGTRGQGTAAAGRIVSTGPAALTDAQRRVLDAITRHIQSYGYPPTVREIGKAAGFESHSTVTHHLRSLVDKGLIRRDPNRPRAIQILETT